MTAISLQEEDLQLRAERARDRLSAGLGALRVKRRRLVKKLRPARYLVPALAVGTAAMVLGLMLRRRGNGPSLLGELARRALLAAAGVVATRLAQRAMDKAAVALPAAASDDD